MRGEAQIGDYALLPTGLLAKPGAGEWREKILKHNSLLAVCQLPNELFQPFAAATTSFVVLEKGVPHGDVAAFMPTTALGVQLFTALVASGRDGLDSASVGLLMQDLSGTPI